MTVGAGFDPSISSLGLGVVRRAASRYAVVWAKTIRTSTKEAFELRCDVIVDALSAMLHAEQPSFLAIEDQRFVQAGKWREGEFQSNNGKTLVVQGLAQATARVYRIPVILVQPQRVKIAVLGSGNRQAKKIDLQRALERLTGEWLSQDSADGVATAIAGCQKWVVGRRAA